MKAPPTPQKDGHRINRDIRVREVQLIDHTGKNHGAIDIVEAQKIVQAHQGSIDVRSIQGKGTTFTLTLPLKR